jgi:HTH-type transcriptional regulator/antitoxin HigA
MTKRGWIASTKDPDELLQQILQLAQVKRPEDIGESSLAYAAKQTYYGRDLEPVQEAWLWRVKQIAEAMPMDHAYNDSALRSRLEDLRTMASEIERLAEIPKLLEQAGVRFLIVEALPGARIDGVTLWLKPKSPVIALTLRFDRLDNFWFVLRHEIEHVLRGDGRDEAIVDVSIGPGAEISSRDLSKEEKAANDAAGEFFFTQRHFLSFLSDLVDSYSEQKVTGFASTLNVHPAIVVGQIHNRLGRYDILRKYLAKVRHVITQTAVTDGFGRLYRLSA